MQNRSHYTLLIAVCFLAFPSLAQTPLPCGQTLTGNIAAAKQRDSYTFTAASGDAVTIRVARTSGSLSANLELYNSSNSRISYTTSGRIDTILSAAGAYTVYVSDYGGAGTGGYSMVWQRLNNPANATAINPGQTVSGTIAVPGETDFYTFTAAANDKVTIRMKSSSTSLDEYLELYSPSGQRLMTNDYPPLDTTLSAAGIYVLVARGYFGTDTGNYSLVWQRLNNPSNAAPLNCGQIVAGSIAPAGKSDFYTFTASAGDVITARMKATSGTLDEYLELYGPSGTRVGTADYPPLNATLTTAGTYTLIARDYYGSRAGNYSLMWQRLKGPCNATPLACGQVVSGSIGAPVDLDAYTFTANSGDQLQIRTKNWAPSSGLYVELYDVNGVSVATGYSSLDKTLASSGAYALLVRPSDFLAAGSYGLSLNRANSPCPLVDNEPPRVTLLGPKGGEALIAGMPYRISWTSTDNDQVASQEIWFSTDGGATYPTLVAGGLAGSVSYNDSTVPNTLSTTTGRVKVIAKDRAGNTGQDASRSNFAILGSTLPSAVTTNYQYDALGRLTRATYPNGSAIAYEYDAAGNITRVAKTAASLSATLNPVSATAVAAGGTGWVAVSVTPAGAAWTAVGNVDWITVTAGASGTGNGTVTYQVAPNPAGPRTGTLTIAWQTFTVVQAGTAFTLDPVSATVPAGGGSGSVSVTAGQPGASWTASSNAAWITITAGASGAGNGTVTYQAAANSTSGPRTGTLTIAGLTFPLTQPAAGAGLGFYPVTPCRIADTRTGYGKTGAFGPPFMGAQSTRAFPVPASSCGIPAAAQAYSLNITAVPRGPLSYVSIWPAGQAQPLVSTLNSFDGRVIANAAVVPAGSGGAINVYASDQTDVIIDINGYFAPPDAQALAFYPVAPCRVADTRASGGKSGAFGPPSIGGAASRDFPVPQSACGIPPSARAYSLNMTVVPPGPLAYLTAWPAAQPIPVVSTLNSFDGAVVANAAIVPAGTGGAISVFVSNPSEVLFDVNGYFAPPGNPGALLFYPASPCRLVDTRSPGGKSGAFGPPVMAGGSTRAFPLPAGGCNLPAAAQAYSLNVTVVPSGTLSYLSIWPSGQPQPLVSTLNSFAGKVVANAAIVPAGAGGSVAVYVTDATELVIDVNGYFAP